MDSGRPAYRVALCRTVLARMQKLPEFGDICGAAPPGVVEKIESRRSLTWLDGTVLDDLNRAFVDRLGWDRFVEFWRGHADAARESPLFGPLYTGALRIFGSNPRGLLRWVGRAWQVTTRDFGSLTVDSEAERALVTHVGLPPGHRLKTVVRSTEGSIRGLVSIAGFTPEVAIDDRRLHDEGHAELTVQWKKTR